MNILFQRFKTIALLLILICSSLAVFCPAIQSGPIEKIYECDPFIEIEYNKSLLREPVMPYGKPIEIPIIVKTKVMGPSADIVVDAGALNTLYLIIHL